MSETDDRKRAAEQQVAAAVEKLREVMPTNFILIYENDQDEDVVTMGAFSLDSARVMLDTAIKTVSEQYAYQTAKGKVE